MGSDIDGSPGYEVVNYREREGQGPPVAGEEVGITSNPGFALTGLS